MIKLRFFPLVIVWLFISLCFPLFAGQAQPMSKGESDAKTARVEQRSDISPVRARTAGNTRVRRGPSLSAKVLTVLAGNETVQVIGTAGNWFKVSLGIGRIGWIYKQLILDHALVEQKLLLPGSGGNPISLSFRDMDIRDAFSSLAMEFETNIVLSSAVQGSITLHIFKATLEEAISAIALAGGYTARKKGNTYHVVKAEPGAAVEQATSEVLETRTFKLNYVDMENVKKTLEAMSDARSIEIHEETKTIFVEDTRENIQKIEKIIGFLDAVPKQVMIEARILEVALTDDMAYGVDWSTIWGDVNAATNGFSTAVLPKTPGEFPVGDGSGDGFFANMITQIGSDHYISLAIDALKEKTTVNTVSTPKILAIHGRSARVQVGGQQGYKVSTTNLGVVSETIEFINTGVILEITPHIDANNNILLNVLPAINSAKIENEIPVVSSTSVSTWLVARDGETVFIGGLIEDIDTHTRQQIPVLGDIPLLGNLFGRTVLNKTKNEIVVLITPRIVDGAHIPSPQEKSSATDLADPDKSANDSDHIFNGTGGR
nr:SH3 domain-containing protein [uncultured Desulfobacter sp.]